MFSGQHICLIILESCSIYIDTSSRHITLPVRLPSNLTASKWALSHGIIAAWFITSTNYRCQINQAPYKMKWQNKLYLEEFSESCVRLQLLAKTAANKSWLKILVVWHWLNWASCACDRGLICKDSASCSQLFPLSACFCILYSLKCLVFKTGLTWVIMASSANNHFIVHNGTIGCKLCKSISPAELQVVVYEGPGLELKDGEEMKEDGLIQVHIVLNQTNKQTEKPAYILF